VARFVFVTPRIVAKITPGLTADGKTKIAGNIISALRQYIEGLGTGKPATGQALLDAIKKVKDVTDPRFVDVRTARADVGRPGTDPLVEALVAKIVNVSLADPDALRTAIGQAISGEGPALAPSGARTPDRSIVQSLDSSGRGASGLRAKDAEIEEGKFIVVPGDQFSLVLEMEAADAALQEG
jgi:hypothetical protein